MDLLRSRIRDLGLVLGLAVAYVNLLLTFSEMHISRPSAAKLELSVFKRVQRLWEAALQYKPCSPVCAGPERREKDVFQIRLAQCGSVLAHVHTIPDPSLQF